MSKKCFMKNYSQLITEMMSQSMNNSPLATLSPDFSLGLKCHHEKQSGCQERGV
jgi:hypothetical protein